MAKRIEWFFVTILNAGKIILKRLKIAKRKCVPDTMSTDSECTERISSLISQLSFSRTTLSELGIRYSLDTIYTFVDDQTSVQATLDNLCNENFEKESSHISEYVVQVDTPRLVQIAAL